MRLWQYAKQLLRKTISSFRECDVSKILATISHHHPPLWVGYKTTVFMLYLLLALPCYGSFDYNTSLKLSKMRQQSDNNDRKLIKGTSGARNSAVPAISVLKPGKHVLLPITRSFHPAQYVEHWCLLFMLINKSIRWLEQPSQARSKSASFTSSPLNGCV